MASTMYCLAAAFVWAIAVVQAKNAQGSLIALETGSAAVVDALKDPNAMLTTLENIVQSGETPAHELIATIKSLVLGSVMPGVDSAQGAAAEETTNLLNAVESCNNASKTREGSIEGSTEVSVNSSRSLHAACRDIHKALHLHNLSHHDSYCVKLGKFLHHAAPLRIADGTTRADAVQYVKNAHDTNMCDVSEVTQLADNCLGKENDISAKTDECSLKQGIFEMAFCTWKTQLESNCQQLDTCHAAAMTDYSTHVNKTQTLVKKWNVETASLKKILCYCEVWLSDTDERDNRSQHDATQFETCKDQNYVPEPVSYGTPAEKVACLLTSVAIYPGTTGFVTQEYGSFTDFVKPVVPCPSSTTAVAPVATADAAPVAAAPVAPVATVTVAPAAAATLAPGPATAAPVAAPAAVIAPVATVAPVAAAPGATVAPPTR